jgi:hypothetical protein
MNTLYKFRCLSFGVVLLSIILLSACNGGSSNIFLVHVRYASQFDANELWLMHHDKDGNEIRRLIMDDLTEFVPGVIDYRQDLDVYMERLHDPADEPDILPYYQFLTVQQKLELNGEAIYRDAPVLSEAFAVHVNHLGAGYSLLEEWMWIFDAVPEDFNSKFIQYYCGPDLLYHYYWVLLEEETVGSTHCEHPTPTPTLTPYPSKTRTINPELLTPTSTEPFGHSSYLQPVIRRSDSQSKTP